MATPYEQEFERRLGALDRDARACASFAYVGFGLNYSAGGDPDLLDRLNVDAGFWQTVIAALQVSTFVSLGRIFDRRGDAHSADNLLDYAENYPGIFSRAALEARKISVGLDPGVAAMYARDAFEPRTGEFQHLRAELDARSRFYAGYVEPIRNQVYAHSGQLTVEQRDDLFTSLPLRKLEELAVFPLRLHRALWDLFHNGREPLLAAAPSLVADVMKGVPERGVNSWEHLHAAGYVRGFLARLKELPGPDG